MHAPTSTHRSPREQEPQRILCVGSDLCRLAALREVLKKPAFHIVSCPDRGSATLFINCDTRYDFFLFDFEMRDLAAFELAELAQSLNHRRRVAIMIAASEANTNLEEFARNAGVWKCVSKNGDTAEVPRITSRWLSVSKIRCDVWYGHPPDMEAKSSAAGPYLIGG